MYSYQVILFLFIIFFLYTHECYLVSRVLPSLKSVTANKIQILVHKKFDFDVFKLIVQCDR